MKVERVSHKNFSAKAVAERWKAQYFKQGQWYTRPHDCQRKYEKLLLATSPKEVNRIIGNNSWTSQICNVCEKSFTEGFVVHWYEETTAICDHCMDGLIEMRKTT